MRKNILRRFSLAMALAVAFPGLSDRARADGPAQPKDLRSALQPFVDRHTLAGAVLLVADKDKVLAVETVGFADIDAGRPMQPGTLFWIASQSKPITSAALMMLVDEGKVRLDDPVAKYLPEFKDVWLAAEQDKDHQLLKRPAKPLTVRTVLSHTSGLPFRSALEQPTLDLLPLRVAVQSYAITPLQSEPGSRYQYSNAGINTAGRIIEVVSGMPYQEFVDRRLFRPLGMKNTTFRPDENQLKRLAKSYKPGANKTGLVETTITRLVYPLNDSRRQPVPAGGLFATAGDVGRFCQLILNGGTWGGKRYLSESAIEQMTTKQTAPSMPEAYGLGWSTGGGTFGHGGAYSTNMTVDPKRGLFTVFMVQHAGFPGDGDKSHGAFRKAAFDLFGDSSKGRSSRGAP